MAYTKPSISGYNANPPPDDGTTVDANAVRWSNHITKIGDPLQSYANAINNATETAWNDLASSGAVTQGAALVAYKHGGSSGTFSTGASARTLDEELDEVSTPERFGGTGDGSADDTAALTAAINASPVVRLRPGATYKITSSITTTRTDQVIIIGYGATIDGQITAADATSEYWLDFSSNNLEVQIHGVTFTGTNMPNPTTAIQRTPINVQGTSFASRCPRVWVKDCHFKDLLYEKTANSVVDHAIRVWWADNVVIEGCTFDNVKGWSTYVQNCQGVVVNGNFSDGNGWGAHGLRGSIFDCTVTGNVCVNQTASVGGAIDFLGVVDDGKSSDITISGNHCQGEMTKNVGLRIKGVRNCLVSANTVVLDTANDTTRSGILVSNKESTNGSSPENVTVSGNTIIADGFTSANAIFCYNETTANEDAANIAIVGNVILEYGSGQFLTSGIRYGNDANDKQTNGVLIANNTVQATPTGTGTNAGGIAVLGSSTVADGLTKVVVSNNSVSGQWIESSNRGIRLSGEISGCAVQNNAIHRYYYPIQAVASTNDGLVFDGNTKSQCVESSDPNGDFAIWSLFGADGAPDATNFPEGRVPKNSVIRLRNPSANNIRSWYSTTGNGSFSTQTTTATGTSGTNTVTVASAIDLMPGDLVSIAGEGNVTVLKVSGTTVTLAANLSTSPSSAALAHVDPTLRAGQEPCSGTTANRPTGMGSFDAGFTYYDTTLAKVIFWDGAAWEDATGAAA